MHLVWHRFEYTILYKRQMCLLSQCDVTRFMWLQNYLIAESLKRLWWNRVTRCQRYAVGIVWFDVWLMETCSSFDRVKHIVYVYVWIWFPVDLITTCGVPTPLINWCLSTPITLAHDPITTPSPSSSQSPTALPSSLSFPITYITPITTIQLHTPPLLPITWDCHLACVRINDCSLEVGCFSCSVHLRKSSNIQYVF